ncbi:peptidase M14 [Agrobacterium larrymoorei]|uniref:M14 family metallopeptidase n=1 Tax=Agrobacterium larrymoorei TaxID=160699 RepID=UPI0015740811|nr:M14 family metallopeptidase [Agrobacterium larrymoorei]NTJ41891.1 peptidase M14 [Agrobacterium larrymoorei]
MTVIFEKRFERTLDKLEAEAINRKSLQAWTFDDRASRTATENRLAQKGIKCCLFSAYKPLLHAFIEHIDLSGVEAIEVFYPVHANAPENRFRLEAYPLAAMVGERKIHFVARSDDAFYYDVLLKSADGERKIVVPAPNRVHPDFAGETSVSPTGWLAIDGNEGQRLETDYEALFAQTMEAITRYDWGNDEPYFEELNIRVTHPAGDETLPVGDERTSLREALHEDFYFSLLEFFQKKSGRPLGDRGLKPGQIVPEIVQSNGEISVRVELKPLSTGFTDGAAQEINGAESRLSSTQIFEELASIEGLSFEAKSRAGRPVLGRYRKGTDAAVMISGGQHANETTGVTGALRAAKTVAARNQAHFTISPLENPDGYALHQRLCAENPRHMHHAARYTALGDDLEYRTEATASGFINEKQIRFQAQNLSGAQLHVNLHGYPSHEWTRPLSGYIPRNFAMWTVPKGFFLIARYHAEWESRAEDLLNAVTRHLGAIPGLLDYNNRQIALYEIHAGETGFRIINGFPCLASVDDRHDVPMTLITEYPDETIYGADFISGHTAQMETVLSAYDAWQRIMRVA